MKNAYLTDVLGTLDRMTSEYQRDLGKLTGTQLNWKPNPKSWSVGQCIDHIITTNKLYFKIFADLISGTKPANFWEKIPFLPGFFGNYLIKATQPEITKKGPTTSVFEPSASTIPNDILEQFLENQKQLIDWVKKTDQFDHQKTILTSPAAKFVVYSLHDVCIILSGHEERHLNQARNVMKMEGFPNQ